jgi:hypothetical protein
MGTLPYFVVPPEFEDEPDFTALPDIEAVFGVLFFTVLDSFLPLLFGTATII